MEKQNIRYVFFMTSIQNMGGAQMYVRSKMLWLREKGWNVDVIFSKGGNIIIPEFKKCNMLVPELSFFCYLYSSRRKSKVCNKLIKFINADKFDKVIIETSGLPNSSWGELVASILGCKHIVYSLQEKEIIPNYEVAKYLKFKLDRKELAGITDSSLYHLFKPYFEIEKSSSYYLIAHSINGAEDIDSPLCTKIIESSFDYVIGSIGRLDKPYLIKNIEEVLIHAKSNPLKLYLLLLIGDAPKGTTYRKRIESMCKNVSNVELIITGYMYPLQRSLIRLCDVCFSSAGSAKISKDEGVPTISIDGRDYLPIGVLGYTTNMLVFREFEIPRPLSNYLDDILVKKMYQKNSVDYSNNKPDYSDHISFIENSSIDLEYYKVESLKLNDWKDLRIKIILSIIGPRLYLEISKFMNKLIL